MADGRLDELARRASAQAPDWNDVREQRVLAAIQRAPRARAAVSRRWPVAGAAVAIAAAAALAVWWGPVRWGAGEAPPDTAGRLELADGSVCRLSPDARVRVLAQSEDLVRLEQTAGEVEYDVSHRPERAFEVIADPAVVRVRGTRFTVTVDLETVAVAVSEGRVEVEARGQRTVLGRGDALQVARAEPLSGETDSPEREGVGGRAAEGRIDPDETEPLAGARAADGPVARTDSPDPVAAPGSTVRPRRPRPQPAASAPEPAAPEPTVDSIRDRLARADAHRRAGRIADAADELERLIADHPSDPQTANAAFILGRLQRRLDRPAQAAAAFARARDAAPAGPLAEDALAEEALAWRAAGDVARARAAATRYLALHADGLHASRMRALVR